MPKKRINNLIVVSDIHSGCQLALCPPQGGRLDEGGIYKPNRGDGELYSRSKVWTVDRSREE